MTLAMGAKQLVVQDALETTSALPSYLVWFTPTTNIGASAEGAEMMTFLAPPPRWACGFEDTDGRAQRQLVDTVAVKTSIKQAST